MLRLLPSSRLVSFPSSIFRLILALCLVYGGQQSWTQDPVDPNGDALIRQQLFEEAPGSAKSLATLVDIDAGDAVEGDYIRDLMFYDNGQKVLVSNGITQNMTVLDFSSRMAIADIPLTGSPHHFDILEPWAVVAMPFDDQTAIIDLDGDSVLAYLPTPGEPNRVRIDENLQRAYVASFDSSRCYIIDLNSLSVVGTLEHFASGIQSFGFITSNNRSGFEYFDFGIGPDGNYAMAQDTSFDGVAFHNLNTLQIDTVFPHIDPYFAVEVSDSAYAFFLKSTNPAVVYRVDLNDFSQDSVVLTGNSVFSLCRNFVVNPTGDQAVISSSNGTLLADFNSSLATTISPDPTFWMDHSGDRQYAVLGGFETRVYDFLNATQSTVSSGNPQNMGAASRGSIFHFAGIDPLRREYLHAYEFNSWPFLNRTGDMNPGSAREGDAPFRPAISADGSTVLVGNQLSHSASIFDAIGGSLDTIIDGLDETSFAAAITSDGQYGLVGDYDGGKLHVVDMATRSIVASPNVGDRPAIVRVSPDDQFALTANIRDNTLTLVNISGAFSSATGTVPIGTIGVSWTIQGIFSDVRFSPNNDFALAAASFDDQVKVVNLNPFTVVHTLNVGDFPTQIAFTDDGFYAAVINKNDGNCSLIAFNGANSSVVATVPCGSNPTRITYDALTDEFLVASLDDQGVYRFNARNGNSTGVLSFAPDYRPLQVEVLSTGHRAYLLANVTAGLDDVLRVNGVDYALPANPNYMVAAENSPTIAITMTGPDFVSIFSGDTLVSLQPITRADAQLDFSPNPASDRINIEVPHSFSQGELEVLDLQGRSITVVKIDNQRQLRLSTQSWPAGIYFLRLQTGERALEGKLIKP